ncbi:MAG TPA: MqnA/MqnD/SBP family protein [Bacteroidota bacterium]
MEQQRRLGILDALYLRPLLYGLDRSSPFTLSPASPAKLSQDFRERPELFRGAFLSPLDYARSGADYHIVPGICAASSSPTGTVRLYVNPGKSNISTLAVDVRVTSEIILSKIVLLEKFPNLPAESESMKFIPMEPDPKTMLAKADAALVVSFFPSELPPDLFFIDLVEEWNEMTGLPYVHGMWVGREDHLTDEEIRALHLAKQNGVAALSSDIGALSQDSPTTGDALRQYFSQFTYDLGDVQAESLKEFFRYAFYHGILGDIPDLNFFSASAPNPTMN